MAYSVQFLCMEYELLIRYMYLLGFRDLERSKQIIRHTTVQLDSCVRARGQWEEHQYIGWIVREVDSVPTIRSCIISHHTMHGTTTLLNT